MSGVEMCFIKFNQAQTMQPSLLSLATHTSLFLLQPTFKSTITRTTVLGDICYNANTTLAYRRHNIKDIHYGCLKH